MSITDLQIKRDFQILKLFIYLYMYYIFSYDHMRTWYVHANLYKYRMVCGKKIACDVYLIQVSVFDYVTFLLFLFSLFGNRLILTTTKYCVHIELIY